MGISPCSPIGIFDSGIGGLLIAKEIKNYMPNECIIYFGDTKNMPYGNKSKEFIRNHSMKIASFLYEKKCKAIVIACNSIVSNALDVIQKNFLKKILIFNVIEPIVKNKVLISSKRIGIMATPATIRSNFYQKNIKRYCPHLDIVQISTPLLATIIENGFEKKKINYLKNYLNHFKSIKIDTLLLACTHYLFLKKEIDNFFHGKVRLIDIQKIVVQEIQKKLYENNLLCLHSTWNNNPIFYTSSSISPFFNEKIKILFGKKILVKRHLFNFF